jgi:hypothetical protein
LTALAWWPPIVAVLLAAACKPVAQESAAPEYPRIYQYTYPHNTPSLNENHYIVLDSLEDGVRAWYYGTSDDFDSVREGYLPGFFVAEMENLRITDDSISFTLRPREMFTSPVPLEYRRAADAPAGTLERWTGPSLAELRRYAGTRANDRLVLEDRVFGQARDRR